MEKFEHYISLIKEIKEIENENPSFIKKRYIKVQKENGKKKTICPCCNKSFSRYYMFYHKKTKNYLEWLNAQKS